MNEKNESVHVDTAVEQEFNTSYTDKVHVIGRITMAIAFLLSFLPVLYLHFVKGYQAPLSAYITVATTIAAMRVGMWISEPFTWYPVLGSASLYMGYFSGNVKNLRVPVAQNLQSKYNVEVNSPKGQVITTIGVGISVFVNIVILLIVVAVGTVIIPMLPPVVLSAFNYVIPTLIGSLLAIHFQKRGFVGVLRWVIPSIIVFFLMKSGIVPPKYATSISIAATVLAGYIVFVAQGKIEDKKEANKG
ncbi:hypothetical protein [Pseudoflavonifractor sp. MSJ-37]|uniref:hypothetical protein n=1 Tax=Pseudoflavonifractor sp. MSJ-37 TaxID=2841531 RepID=UPI001C10B29F|nr:hypothetical protein [Pseudoflavonifractor sp. MSJ-37]MBU5434222.1 hypothetical protein [Pseudoflavonifractor sp. MSJ-37]